MRTRNRYLLLFLLAGIGFVAGPGAVSANASEGSLSCAGNCNWPAHESSYINLDKMPRAARSTLLRDADGRTLMYVKERRVGKNICYSASVRDNGKRITFETNSSGDNLGRVDGDRREMHGSHKNAVRKRGDVNLVR